MDDTTEALLALLRMMLEDEIFEDYHGIHPEEGSLDSLERALANWKAEGYPDTEEG